MKTLTDDEVNAMHPRQAAVLIEVPAPDRRAVLRHAHVLQNTVPGYRLSGALEEARRYYLAAGLDALIADTDRRAGK